MGIINVFKGLESEREIFNFNGIIKDNLNLEWDHVKILKGEKELSRDYEVSEDDILLIYETPSGAESAGWTLVFNLLTGGIYSMVASAVQAKRESDKALKRIGTKPELASVPEMGDARNEAAAGKNAPIILGRHIFAPYFLSEPYMTIGGKDGEDLYWYGSFLAGQDGLCIERIRNGVINLVTFPGDTAQTGRRFFNTPGTPFYNTDSYAVIAQKGYQFATIHEDGIFEHRWVDSLDSFEELERVKIDNAQTKTINISTMEGSVSAIVIEDDGPEEVIRETAKFPMMAEIELSVDGLHGWDSENEQLTRAALAVSVEWSKYNDYRADWRHLTPQNTSAVDGWHSGMFNGMPGYSLSRMSAKKMRFIFTLPLNTEYYSDTGDPVYIRARRLTEMYSGGYRDRVYISAIRTRQYNPQKSSSEGFVAAANINGRLKNKFCRIGIKLKVNENIQKDLDRFNIIATMTGRTWNGRNWGDNDFNEGNKVKTTNPAAVLLELLTGLIHDPSKHGDDEIDWPSFRRLHDYCWNRGIYAGTPNRITLDNGDRRVINLRCNGVLTNATRKIDAIKLILATCDGGLYVNEYGKLSVYFDHRQTTPVALLNPQRIVKMTEQRSFDRKADGYSVEFINENTEWTQDTHRILRPRVAENPGLNTFTTVKLEFITDYYQAMWQSRRMMAKEIHRPGELKIQVGQEGRLYKPGSLIKVQHERFKIGLGSGEIVEYIVNDDKMITAFRLMERFDISKDHDYFIEYYVVDGGRNHVAGPQPEIFNRPELNYQTLRLQSVGEYTDILTLATPLPMNDIYTPGYDNILSVMHGPRTARIYEAKRYIVTGLSENAEGYDLTLIPYSDVVYQDSSFSNISPYVSSIMPSAPRVYNDATDQKTILEGRIPDIREQVEIAESVAESVAESAAREIVANETPRYRGAYETVGNIYVDIDNNRTGVIGNLQTGVIMNSMDWFAYTGTGGFGRLYFPGGAYNIIMFRTGMCYRWTGELWAEIPVEDTAPYMAALADLTHNAPSGAFSTIFASRLMVLDATIKALQAQVITLEQNELGQGGVIQSKSYEDSNGAEGWMVDHEGNAIFNHATIKGDSEIKGTLVIGGVWDKDGRVINANARGSLFAFNRNLTGENYEIRIKNLQVYGSVQLGLSIGNSNTNITLGNSQSRLIHMSKRYIHHGTLIRSNGTHVRGLYTAQDIYNRIHEIIAPPITSEYYVSYPVSGSIYHSNASVGLTVISRVSRPDNTRYFLYGISSNGTRIVVVVTNTTNISIANEATDSQIVSISGLTVDLMFF